MPIALNSKITCLPCILFGFETPGVEYEMEEMYIFL
jgi:hypothetical protein